MEDDRIETTRNRVFVRELAFGKDSPIAMKTNDNFVYRVTGMDQVEDIITSGYARSKDKVKGGHNNELFWTRGGDKLFYYDKRPVLEAPYTKVQDGQMGAISLEDLTAIWIFNEKENTWIMESNQVNTIDVLVIDSTGEVYEYKGLLKLEITYNEDNTINYVIIDKYAFVDGEVKGPYQLFLMDVRTVNIIGGL